MEDLTGNSSKTTFYVESIPDKIKRFAWVILLIALVIGAIILWSGIGSGARTAMDHAKDVRLAMKMVSMEYYGGKSSIYDPSAESGLTDEAIAKIRNINLSAKVKPVSSGSISYSFLSRNNFSL